MKSELKPYVVPSIRIIPVRMEDSLLTVSTEPIPDVPLDPEFE